MLRLIRLTAEYQKQLGEMIDEWKHDQELHLTRTFLRSFSHEYVH